MNGPLLSFLALVVTLGVLITVHEFGHFWVARRCGVRVLRFAIGFGRPLWRRTARDGVEYVIGAVPLGGYVRMLDEREGEVPPEQLDQAFNRQTVGRRAAIVAAGPAFNFAFAILAYLILYLSGVSQVRPVLAEAAAGTPAAIAGIRDGDEVLAVGDVTVQGLDELLMRVAEQMEPGEALKLRVRDADGRVLERRLPLPEDLDTDGSLLARLGLQPWRPSLPAVIGSIKPDSPAAAAGLQDGDRIVSVDDQRVADWQDFATRVRAKPEADLRLQIERDGSPLSVRLRPVRIETAQGAVGQIGAFAAVPQSLADSLRVVVRYGPIDATVAAVERTWEMSAFTLRMLGRMLTGRASLDNLSGPLTIAQMAGQSASIGLSAFLSFLALVSISLGVLNLLPVPVLDGGHLAWYAIETIKGSPVSEAVQSAGQRVGLAVLLVMMGLAFYNDLARLFGP